MGKLYTIGCSTDSTEQFLDRLQKHNIDAIVDVRSIPFSKFTPQFNRDILADTLKLKRIYYMWFGTEFGARRDEIEVYENGKVNFTKVIELNTFRKGIDRIVEGLKNMNIALMCTEKDPMDCHRFSLVSHGIYLLTEIETSHILINNTLERSDSIEKRMMKKMDIYADLFNSEDEKKLLKRVYQEINWNISYQEPFNLVDQ